MLHIQKKLSLCSFSNLYTFIPLYVGIYTMINSLFVQSVIVVCSDSDVEFWADESDTEWNEAVSSEQI